MTIAQSILNTSTDSTAIFAACEKRSVRTDQNWAYEETLYVFPDESVIVLSGPHADAYESESRAARA
jgi:hypothetical protein